MTETELRWVRTGRRGDGRPALVNIHPEHLDYPGSLPHTPGVELKRWPEQVPVEIETEAPDVQNKAITVEKPKRGRPKVVQPKAVQPKADEEPEGGDGA